MLQAIRSKATSWVIKVLFGILIVSFGIWGIGDILRGPGQQATVAQVGDVSISVAELNSEFRTQIDRLRPLFGGNLDVEKARQMGLLERSLDGLIDRAAVQQELKHLGIAVPDPMLLRRIGAIPAFRNPAGEFDPQRFAAVLRQNNMTEAGFLGTLRFDMTRDQFAGSVAAGIQTPAALADTLFRYRAEKRVADYAVVDPGSMPAPPAPDEAEARAYLEQHKDRFSTPEYRAFEMARVDPAAVMADFKPDAAKLKEIYDQRVKEFERPERRTLLQISLPDEAAAKQAKEELAKGKDFVAVAKEIAKQDEATTRLGAVTRTELPGELAERVFKLDEGAVGEPVQTGFGWNIVKVEKIEQAHTETLDEASPKLVAELAREASTAVVTKLANKFDDERAGGASMAEAAGRAGLKVAAIAAMARDGKAPDGNPVAGLPPGEDVAKAVFETATGADAPLIESGDGGVTFVRVTGVTPPALKPFEQVRGQIVEAITAERRQKEAEKTAQAIADKVKSGRLLPSAAEGRRVETTRPFTRDDGQAFGRLSLTLVRDVFKLKPGEPVSALAGNGYVVAVLREIVPADPAVDKAASERVSGELRQAIAADITAQLTQALRQRIGVDIRQSVIDQMYKGQ